MFKQVLINQENYMEKKGFGPTGKNTYYVVVVGAGASGLLFAAGYNNLKGGSSTDGRGFSGLIIDHNGKAGAKLLISGGGRCNFTHGGNIKDFPSHYHNGKKIRSSLYKHSNKAFVDFMAGLGISATEEEDGRIFPSSMRGSSVVSALERKSVSSGFTLLQGCSITGIIPPDRNSGENLWCLSLKRCGSRYPFSPWENQETAMIYTSSLVIAAGGITFPETGSDGSIHQILEQNLGIRFTDMVPALMNINLKNNPFGQLAGVTLESTTLTVLRSSGKKEKEISGSILLTGSGISGPAAINASVWMEPGSFLQISFVPDMDEGQVRALLEREIKGRTQNVNNIASVLSASTALPKSLTRVLAAMAADGDTPSLKKLSRLLTSYRLEPDFSDLSSGQILNRAMVTKGGICLDQINMKTMEFKDYPGLYAIGEILDVHGETGGYNIQFAYSSAMTAASAISGRQ